MVSTTIDRPCQVCGGAEWQQHVTYRYCHACGREDPQAPLWMQQSMLHRPRFPPRRRTYEQASPGPSQRDALLHRLVPSLWQAAPDGCRLPRPRLHRTRHGRRSPGILPLSVPSVCSVSSPPCWRVPRRLTAGWRTPAEEFPYDRDHHCRLLGNCHRPWGHRAPHRHRHDDGEFSRDIPADSPTGSVLHLWVQIECYGHALTAAEALHPGDVVMIEGTVKRASWVDKAGQTQWRLVVRARSGKRLALNTPRCSPTERHR